MCIFFQFLFIFCCFRFLVYDLNKDDIDLGLSVTVIFAVPFNVKPCHSVDNKTLRRNVLPSVRLNVGAFLSNHIASYFRIYKIIVAVRFELSWSREGSPIRFRTQKRQGEPSLPSPTPPLSGLYTVRLFFLRPLVDFQNVMDVLL